MGIPQYTRLRSYNTSGEFEREQIEHVVRSLQDIPLINGALLKSVPLIVGDKTISHGLGRPLTGWVITRVTSPTFYPLSGTIAPFGGGTTLTGSSTKFQSELVVGDRIRIGGTGPIESRTVSAIASDTSLTVSVAFSAIGGDPDPEKHVPISIYENLDTNARPDITFTLNSSVALTADIWVF